MKVKKYTGKNIQEIYHNIKLDMGNSAVILHSKKTKKGGFFGFFCKEIYEVTAAVEEVDVLDETEEKVIEEIERKQEKNTQITIQKEPEIEIDPIEEPENMQKLDQEFEDGNISDQAEELKKMQQKMEEMISLMDIKNNDYKGELKEFYKRLEEQEVSPKLINRILKKVEKAHSLEDNCLSYRELMIAEIKKIMRRAKPIVLNKKNKLNVIALVGPTGVGKTTTISKLAANFTIKDNKKVSLITVDTYRIAAVEQLKTVGEIIGIPVDVVFTPRGLKNKINEKHDQEMVFIDTAGRSHKKALQMSEIKGFLEAAQPDDVFLVLSASTKYKDMLDIVEKYRELDVKKIIFTKLDETTSYGPLLNLIDKTKNYFSYFTTGQSVPDDIEEVDQVEFVELLLGEKTDE